MNAIEIEDAISKLALEPFDPKEFPYEFLRAFGNKETTLKRLRSGETNKSDLGGVLQAKNIHLQVTPPGEVSRGLADLKASPASAKAKVQYLLATDGAQFEAEDLESGETVACAYTDFPNHFGFFLALAGITTVKQIRENAFDIRATSRLNRLYVELLKVNPEWEKADRRQEMNHFMARLIFCFFAEDTDIFQEEALFTTTVERMSESGSANTHEVISRIFQTMNLKREDRAAVDLPRWADRFPYVNGALFSGSVEVPRFSRIARSYLLHVGSLDWTQINPDIFGSMIQAVADDEERGALGMHYTSVPNILKVLDPLFLDDLRAQLKEAGENSRSLLNLRKRLARIRVFDPACGSGNFLVIAYKQMREIEQTINERRGEKGRKSDIPLTNFRGIELRSFPAEIARLALIIAEFQCNLLYLGQKEALAEFLPLDSQNWITCGNALRLDWLSICPPTGTTPIEYSGDLFEPAQPQLDFENEGGETYICGNPPYKGSRDQLSSQKDDLKLVFLDKIKDWKSLDYVSGWFSKAVDYSLQTSSFTAFVSTNSICQGQHVPILWPYIFSTGNQIIFAHTSFKWSNLASNNAGVTVAIIGISNRAAGIKRIFENSDSGGLIAKSATFINAYLVAGPNIIVSKSDRSVSELSEMKYGNYPGDGNHLTLTPLEKRNLVRARPDLQGIIRPLYGAQEFIKGLVRYCLWISDDKLDISMQEPFVSSRVKSVKAVRLSSRDPSLNKLAVRPHQYRDRNEARAQMILVPTVSSESREFIPVDIKTADAVTTNQSFALYDSPLWNLAIIASRIHIVWIATVCGKLKTDFRYSNTLGWNTFPVPTLTGKHKADLTRCAEKILLAREAHFPATIADLYDPETMPADLRAAHEHNDEVLERIYIGRRFRNDTERLEKLFDLYSKMTASNQVKPAVKASRGKKTV